MSDFADVRPAIDTAATGIGMGAQASEGWLRGGLSWSNLLNPVDEAVQTAGRFPGILEKPWLFNAPRGKPGTGAPNTGASPATALNGVLGLYGGATGLYDAYKADNWFDRTMGGANAFSGLTGFASSAANFLGAEAGFFGGLGSTGAAGFGGGGLAGSIANPATWVGTAEAGAGWGTAAGTGALLSTVAGCVGAAAGGAGLGMYGNQKAQDLGWFRDPATGEAETVSQRCGRFAGELGNDVDDFIGGSNGGIQDTVGDVAGKVVEIAAAIGTTGPGVLAALGAAGAGAVSDLWSWIAD
jgi:hypothetical protein